MTTAIVLCIFLAIIGFALGALTASVIIAILWPLGSAAANDADAAERRHG